MGAPSWAKPKTYHQRYVKTVGEQQPGQILVMYDNIGAAVHDCPGLTSAEIRERYVPGLSAQLVTNRLQADPSIYRAQTRWYPIGQVPSPRRKGRPKTCANRHTPGRHRGRPLGSGRYTPDLVLGYLADHPGLSATKLVGAMGGFRNRGFAVVNALIEAGHIVRTPIGLFVVPPVPAPDRRPRGPAEF